MLLPIHKTGFFIILAFCFFENISPSPQRDTKQVTASVSQMTGSTPKLARLTESYLPALMQALAYYIELIQYEPLHTTTIEPPFTVQTTPLILADSSTANTTPRSTTQNVPSTTWWSPPPTITQRPPTITQRPPTTSAVTQPKPTSRPSTSTTTTTTVTQVPIWVSSSVQSIPTQVTTTPKPKPRPTTRRPLGSTTTPSWWHPETTPYHSPGYFAPQISGNSVSAAAAAASVAKEPLASQPKPQIGDLTVLSIANFPYFDYYVPSNTKSFVRKPEYEFLDQYPAELLQDIENEPYETRKGTDQEIINDFRRVYDDFFARVRKISPIVGKKRVPPTRPYVLFLIFYDLCKREAKRLGLQEFTGYSHDMLTRLNATSKYSAEHQLYNLMYELLVQNSIVAEDFKSRMYEIMTDLANPSSVTAKALHILPPLKFEL